MPELGFHFVSEGRPTALPVVFLSAFPLHSAMWDEQRLALAARAHVIAFDYRGFGPRRVAGTTCAAFMIEHLVDDLIALLDHLRIPAAVLCGLSMGGYVALRAAERNPARVRGLLLANTQAASDSNQAKVVRADGLRSLLRDGAAVFVESVLKRGLAPHTYEHRHDLLTRARTLMLESDASAMAVGLVALAARSDTTDSLSRISVPTSVVVGEYDIITAPLVAQLMAAKIPEATLTMLEHAGHLSNLEAPAGFNRALFALLDRVEAHTAASV